MSWGQGCVRVPRLTCDLDVSHLVRLLTFIVGVPGRYNAQGLGKQSKDWDGVGRGLWMLTVETTNKICELVFCQPRGGWVNGWCYTIQYKDKSSHSRQSTQTHTDTHTDTELKWDPYFEAPQRDKGAKRSLYPPHLLVCHCTRVNL